MYRYQALIVKTVLGLYAYIMWKNREQEPTPTDYRKTRRKQDRTLLVLVLVVLVVGGTGLIGLIWGVRDAVQGGLCLLAGGALIAGLWFLLSLVEKVVDR